MASTRLALNHYCHEHSHYLRMSLTVRNAVGELDSLDAAPVVHLRSVEVEYRQERKKYPISIQAAVGDDSTVKSRRYKANEIASLDIHKQLVSTSTLVITVKEHHTLSVRDEIIVSIRITANELFMKPILMINEPDGKALSVKIHCEAPGPFIDIIRLLVEESQKRLDNMKVFLERLGKVCETLNVIVNVADPVSQINTIAKTVVSTVTALLKLCREKKECCDAASALMADISSFLPFSEIPKGHLKTSVTTQAVQEMLLLFEKISRRIIQCTSGSVIGMLLGNEMDEVRSYKEDFLKLKETLDWCVKTEIWRTVLKVEEQTEGMVLTRLRPVMDAYYKENRSCLPGSRQVILQAIKEWSASQSTANIFWLHGFAGCGKTTVSNTVAGLFDEQNRLAGCFFCDKIDPARRNPEKILPTITYQLSKWHRTYRSLIVDVLQDSRELNLNSGLRSEFKVLVEQPLARLSFDLPPKHKPLVIVLDAIDECCDSEESRRLLASYVWKLSSLVPWLKVFVSSMKTRELETYLGREDSLIFDMGEPKDILHDDIAAYAKHLASPRSAWSEDLEYRASSCLARICKDLQVDKPLIPDRATTKRAQFDAFFCSILDIISEREGYDDNARLVVKEILVLLACLSLTRPPPETMFLRFLQQQRPGNDMLYLRNTLDSLQPEIICRSSTGLLHFAFPLDAFTDLVSDQQRALFLWTNIDLIKSGPPELCFAIMRSQLKFNICGLESSHIKNSDILELGARIGTYISEALKYSSLHWMDYVVQAGSFQNIRGLVIDFLCSSRALYWIEVLSLTGALKAGEGILLTCAGHFKDDDEIVNAATELRAFISNFSGAMEISTPHVYVSALLWISEESFVAKRCCSPSIRRSQLVMKYGSHDSVDVNPETDSESIESVGMCSSMACSSDGSMIATRHYYGSVRIWDTRNGKCIAKIKDNEGEIGDFAFSPDSSRIVTGSYTTLRIWEARTGSLVAGPLKGYDAIVWSVAYSPDGQKIASGSDDATIQIWDARSGSPLGKPFARHTGSISIAFSPDGRRIVSGSDDNTIRIWDVENGALIHVLEGHGDIVRSVSYSPDGTYIISGSFDRTVMIWDAQNGNPIGGPLQGHEAGVIAVGHSHSGNKIISWSLDHTLRLWDPKGGKPVGVVHRGESLWDMGEHRFFSIPRWINGSTKIEFFKNFDWVSQVPDNGWLRTLEGGLFLWVPPKFRSDICWRNPRVKVDWTKLEHGNNWTKVWGVED